MDIVPAAFLVSTPWPGLLLWCTLYTSDYWFTLSCARMYQRGVSDHIVFDGSYELNPFYQRDIDALRAWSPRFLTVLPVSALCLWGIWRPDFDSGPYLFVLGSLLLTELAIHIRHLHNWFLFRTIVRRGGIQGHIEYPRRVLLEVSSVDTLAYASLFAVVFVFTGSPFVLGGAVSCAGLAIQQFVLARKHVATVKQPSSVSHPSHT